MSGSRYLIMDRNYFQESYQLTMGSMAIFLQKNKGKGRISTENLRKFIVQKKWQVCIMFFTILLLLLLVNVLFHLFLNAYDNETK